jgi:hypothetical protein
MHAADVETVVRSAHSDSMRASVANSLRVTRALIASTHFVNVDVAYITRLGLEWAIWNVRIALRNCSMLNLRKRWQKVSQRIISAAAAMQCMAQVHARTHARTSLHETAFRQRFRFDIFMSLLHLHCYHH